MEQLRRCEWCGQRFAVDRRPGRPPKYCRPSHRQRHYEARREAALRGLQPGDVLLTRDQYEAWSDHRYVLETLVEDIVADLEAGATVEDLRAILAGLAGSLRAALDAFPEPAARG